MEMESSNYHDNSIVNYGQDFDTTSTNNYKYLTEEEKEKYSDAALLRNTEKTANKSTDKVVTPLNLNKINASNVRAAPNSARQADLKSKS